MKCQYLADNTDWLTVEKVKRAVSILFAARCPCILKGAVDKCCPPHSLHLSYISVRPQAAMSAPDKAKLQALGSCASLTLYVCVCVLHVSVYENRWRGCVFSLSVFVGWTHESLIWEMLLCGGGGGGVFVSVWMKCYLTCRSRTWNACLSHRRLLRFCESTALIYKMHVFIYSVVYYHIRDGFLCVSVVQFCWWSVWQRNTTWHEMQTYCSFFPFVHNTSCPLSQTLSV